MKKTLKVSTIVTAVASAVYCLLSAFFGDIGYSKGIFIGGQWVGHVSRYLDPFIMGLTVIIVSLTFKYCPPSINPNSLYWFMKDNNYDRCFFGLIASLFIFLLFSMLGVINKKDFSFYSSYNFNPLLLLITIFVPFGMKGASIALALLFAFFWVRNGILLAVFLVIATWVGKWVLWWIWRIMISSTISEFKKIKY